MGISIEGLGTVDPDRWERTDPDAPDYLTVAAGDSRFQVYVGDDGTGSVSIDMSYGRWSWLQDYIEAVGASKLLHRNKVAIDPEDVGPYSHIHPVDCLAVADALDAEIQAGRHHLYCSVQPAKAGVDSRSRLDHDDITRWRDWLRVCGGYRTW